MFGITARLDGPYIRDSHVHAVLFMDQSNVMAHDRDMTFAYGNAPYMCDRSRTCDGLCACGDLRACSGLCTCDDACAGGV